MSSNEIVHGFTHFLIDDAVVQPLHIQIGGHMCHKDKFGIDARHDLEILVIHDDVRRLKLTNFNDEFFHLANGFAAHPFWSGAVFRYP